MLHLWLQLLYVNGDCFVWGFWIKNYFSIWLVVGVVKAPDLLESKPFQRHGCEVTGTVYSHKSTTSFSCNFSEKTGKLQLLNYTVFINICKRWNCNITLTQYKRNGFWIWLWRLSRREPIKWLKRLYFCRCWEIFYKL